MKKILGLVLVFFAIAPAFGGVTSTECSDPNGRIRLESRGMGHFEGQTITVDGKTIEELGMKAALSDYRLIKESGDPRFHLNRIYVQKLTLTGEVTDIVEEAYLICSFRYGF